MEVVVPVSELSPSGFPPVSPVAPHRRACAALGIVLVLTLGGAAVSCGSDGRTLEGAGEGADAGSEIVDPGVPCLPPECGTTVPAEAGDGYIGPQPGPNTSATAAVDGGSVVTAETGAWWAQGLVVNGTESLGGTPVVRATLTASSGQVVGVAETPLVVVPLRPGEPAPFRVDAPGVDVSAVASVAWEVAGATPVADASSGRTMNLAVAWSRPPGGDAIDVPGYRDAGGAGSPLLTYVTVRNSGSAAVTSPIVVAAWVDGRGRVFGLATAEVLAPGTATPLASLAPGAEADAVVVLGPPADELVGGLTPLLWGVGR